MSNRYPWTSRAEFHGKRLAEAQAALSADLIGRLAYHEGADVTAAATSAFARTLTAAYEARCASMHGHNTARAAGLI